MTIAATPGVYYYRTNPACTSDRHRPEHRSFARGCRCADTMTAENEYQAKRAAEDAAAAVVRVNCRARRHGDTDNAWRDGCRCPAAVAAHDAKRDERYGQTRAARRKAVEHWKATGECGARLHDSRSAYRKAGCRCPLARKLEAEHQPKRGRRPILGDDRRLKVGRIGLLMLLNGDGDNPTLGEILVADIRLSQRIVPNGPLRGRPLNTLEIAQRLGCTDRLIHRARRVRERLRDERHLRRLADVHDKAQRVARAVQRGRA